MQILLIHPDPTFSTGLGETLERLGATVDYAATGRLGIRLATSCAFDAIVLAAELPDADGHNLCRRLREKHDIATPVMMVGRKAGAEAAIVALEAGADDYQAQPVIFVEAHARLRALNRRRLSTEVLEIGDLRFDPLNGDVHRQGRRLVLPPGGGMLLRVLVEAAPRAVTFAELEACMLRDDSEPMSSNSLRIKIKELRNVVDKPFGTTALIRTCRSIGYRMSVPRVRHERSDRSAQDAVLAG